VKPPPELKSWPKRQLIREVERLRAITREHAETKGDEPIADGGDLVDVAGDPHARGSVILDARNAILLDATDVSLIDTKRDGDEQLALADHWREVAEEHARYAAEDRRRAVALRERGAQLTEAVAA
jgi:hypothetical protein